MPHFPDEQREFDLAMRKKTDDEQDAREQRLRTKNRRKRYLDLHPEYFQQSHLELAGRISSNISLVYSLLPITQTDPLLYDRLVRRFQSAGEREKEGRERGYTGMLETDLVRSEAKLEALQHPDPNSPMVYTRAADGSITGVEQDEDERALGKPDGWERWKEVMRLRFLRGDDGDFEYGDVDRNEEYDDRDEEERRLLEEYLGEEEAAFVGEGEPSDQIGVLDY